jgi:hypothetical protein
MKKTHLVIFSGIFLLFSCTSSNTEKSETESNKLAGTWRLISFSDFDPASNKWVQPYGEHPTGYITYTKSGIVNINVSSQQPLHFSADSATKRSFTIPELLAINGANYFGTYTADFKTSTLVHHPQGGNIPWYIGTDQKREFIIKGDTLLIGDPTFQLGKRILVRTD